MGSLIRKPMYDPCKARGRWTYRVNFVGVPAVMLVVAVVGAIVNLQKLLAG